MGAREKELTGEPPAHHLLLVCFGPNYLPCPYVKNEDKILSSRIVKIE